MAREPKCKRVKVRLPVAKKPSRPIGTPKGEKGYDRKKEREEIEREVESESGE